MAAALAPRKVAKAAQAVQMKFLRVISLAAGTGDAADAAGADILGAETGEDSGEF